MENDYYNQGGRKRGGVPALPPFSEIPVAQLYMYKQSPNGAPPSKIIFLLPDNYNWGMGGIIMFAGPISPTYRGSTYIFRDDSVLYREFGI